MAAGSAAAKSIRGTMPKGWSQNISEHLGEEGRQDRRRDLKDWKQRNKEGGGEEEKGQRGVSEPTVAW